MLFDCCGDFSLQLSDKLGFRLGFFLSFNMSIFPLFPYFDYSLIVIVLDLIAFVCLDIYFINYFQEY